MKRILHTVASLIGLILLGVALVVLHNQLKTHHYHDIVVQLRQIPARQVLLAIVLTAMSYLVLTGYDTLALRYIQYPLAYGKIALVSFIAYAFSHNVGLTLVSGGSVRYRLYSAWGLSALEVSTVVLFCGLTFWLGFFTLAGVAFVVAPLAVPDWSHLPFTTVRPLGIFFLSLVAAWLLFNFLRRAPLKIRGWELRLPSTRIVITQVALACADWALAGTVLFVLLPQGAGLSYGRFLGVFLLAQISGLASQVPGGVGIFETIVLLQLSSVLPTMSILGSLLVFRAIYYLLPLLLASALLGAHEAVQRKEGVKRLLRVFGEWIPGLVPQVLAITTFVGGALLLFSGATPSVGWRLAWLKDLLPLPVMEVSHFLGSVAGVWLLLLAWGLQRRLDAAYVLTVILLVAGIVFSLLKGFDYEEAILLSVMLAALAPCRSYFYRKASVFSQRFTPGWIIAVLLVVAGSIWLGVFSHRHLEFSEDVWWRFTLLGSEAGRFPRATVGATVFLLIFAILRLLQPRAPEPAPSSAEDLDRAQAVIEKSPRVSAYLALLGDKTFLFSDSANAFIMYGIEGRSWIALGDPVGPHQEWAELAWVFREMCDRHGGWTVFYGVGQESLPIYLDLGLTLLKIGEEAIVPLESFGLEGRSRKSLRQSVNRAQEEGCVFEIIPREEIPALLPEFKLISDAWPAEKKTREKGFSLGFFNADYLKRFPAAVVRRDKRIVGFANVLQGAGKHELSLDLMRYVPEQHLGIMEYLFVGLMLWGRQEGYKCFNLGMVPLAGLENRALAPFWTRVGAFVFHHGEHFYNFQGLRHFKQKFDPDWKPKYLASPGGLALPRILTNLASLTSGGLKGIVAK